MLKAAAERIGLISKSPKWAWLGFCYIGCLFFFLFQGGKLAMMLLIIVTILGLYLVMGRWSGIRLIHGSRIVDFPQQEGLVQAGSTLTVKLQIQIPGYWPLPYVFIKDRLHRRNGEAIVFESSFVPDWRRRGEVAYTIPPLRRGYYTFSETSCLTQDIFGLFDHSGSLSIPDRFAVFPETVRIRDWPGFQEMYKGLNQSAAGSIHRETTQINGIREYHHGDRLSQIHWKATAKTGTWKSKEFERESISKVWIVLDRNAEAYPDETSFELAVSVAASLLEFCAGRSLAAGLISAGVESFFLAPALSRLHQKRMMNHLLDVNADSHYSLSSTIRDYSRSFHLGNVFLIISPQSGSSVLQTCQWLEQRRMVPVHFWIQDSSRKEITSVYPCYPVWSLQELPFVLEGRGL